MYEKLLLNSSFGFVTVGSFGFATRMLENVGILNPQTLLVGIANPDQRKE